MSEIPREELLSAFLDGELTADEHAEVEALLANDADSRQLLEEMRALRGDLQKLPSYELSSDFGERVLRQAERSMLLDAAPPSVVKYERLDDDRRWRWTRRLAWPGLAVAAALLISVMTNLTETARQGETVAVAPKHEPELDAEAPTRRAASHPGESDEVAGQAKSFEFRSVERETGDELRMDKGITVFETPAVESDEAQGEELLIVEAEVEPQALREGVFTKLLAGQKIVWEDVAPAPKNLVEEATEAVATEPQVEYVYVEAPLSQIEGALAEMQSQPNQFVSVRIDPAPADERQMMFYKQFDRATAARGSENATAPAPGAAFFQNGATSPELKDRQVDVQLRRELTKLLPPQTAVEEAGDSAGRAQRVEVAPRQQAQLEGLFRNGSIADEELKEAAQAAARGEKRSADEKARAFFLLRAAPAKK